MTTPTDQSSTAVKYLMVDYGNVLTLYDRLLGTFTPSERAESVVYGLDEISKL